MARPLRIEYEGAYYHVVSRGNNKNDIYKSDRDRERFLLYLSKSHAKFKILIHAFCLMPNHYHLLVETPQGNLSRFMHYLNSSYTTYYKIRRELVGHLFQGRYKAILIDKDSYAKELSRYIHLNPVRAGLVEVPEKYQWSSYKYYIERNMSCSFIKTDFIMEYFENSRKKYQKFVNKGIIQNDADFLEKLTVGNILGNDEFMELVKTNYLRTIKRSEDLPDFKKLKKKYVEHKNILKILELEYKENKKKRDQIGAYCLRKYTNKTLREIINIVYGQERNISSISKIVSRIDEKRKNNSIFHSQITKIEEKMSMSRPDPIEIS